MDAPTSGEVEMRSFAHGTRRCIDFYGCADEAERRLRVFAGLLDLGRSVMAHTMPQAALRGRTRSVVTVVSVLSLVVALGTWTPHWAQAETTSKTPVAPPGKGPVSRPWPASALPNHGYPSGQRPPVVPPETRASGPARRLTAAQWTALPKPGARRPADGPPPATGGATDVLPRPGYALDDTSL